MNYAEGLKDEIDDVISEIIHDWSQTGRGSHVDFSAEEAIPLERGRFLGRGSFGDVHETTIRGQKLAWKKISFRRKIGKAEKKEIEIMKKVSHVHMIQLIGTYIHQRELGILMYPVAICDLHTFFEDIEAYWSEESSDAVQEARLEALGFVSNSGSRALPIFTKIGCLVSAIAYLHTNKIRHRDLKPSNILLSRDRLWLSDFGNATDFSLLSQSATDNERGTPRYRAPEMAEYNPSGRAADIFALGCVLLEIFVLQETGSLEHLRQHRSKRDPSFHANLDRIDKWFSIFQVSCARDNHFFWEIRAMLSREPEDRPLVADALKRMKACNDWAEPSIFGDCCTSTYNTSQEHETLLLKSAREREQMQRKPGFNDLDNDYLNSIGREALSILTTQCHEQQAAETRGLGWSIWPFRENPGMQAQDLMTFALKNEINRRIGELNKVIRETCNIAETHEQDLTANRDHALSHGPEVLETGDTSDFSRRAVKNRAGYHKREGSKAEYKMEDNAHSRVDLSSPTAVSRHRQFDDPRRATVHTTSHPLRIHHVVTPKYGGSDYFSIPTGLSGESYSPDLPKNATLEPMRSPLSQKSAKPAPSPFILWATQGQNKPKRKKNQN